MPDERRKDLAKYYKRVKTCKICKGKYGIDPKQEIQVNICPGCNLSYVRGGV